MKLPAEVLSHCLAHGPAVTPEILSRTLGHDKKLGYGGQVIVAALALGATLERIVGEFRSAQMSTLVCGFMAGNGPDPLEDKEEALKALRPQMELARELHLAGLGPNGIVGPMHTHHMHQRANFDREALGHWIAAVESLRQESGLDWVAFEPLNPTEDGTPEAFETVLALIGRYPNLGIHWDSGHAHSWGLSAWDMVQAGQKVRFCELANIGRSPLHHERGIDFGYYADSIGRLPDGCLLGVEPFDQSVIAAFGLEALCDTKTPGPAALASDAEFLRELAIAG